MLAFNTVFQRSRSYISAFYFFMFTVQYRPFGDAMLYRVDVKLIFVVLIYAIVVSVVY